MTAREGSPVCQSVKREDVIQTLSEGYTVPLCPTDYMWVVDELKKAA